VDAHRLHVELDEAAVAGRREPVLVDEFAVDVLHHGRLLGTAVRAVVLEQVVHQVGDGLVPHPLDGEGGLVVVEAAADLLEVFDVAAVGVDVDDAVDAVVGEVARERLDVVAERRRVDPHRPVELLVVRADADVDGGGAEVARPVGRGAGQPLRDEVVGPLREVRPVLFRRPQRDEGQRLRLEVRLQVRPRLVGEIHVRVRRPVPV